MKTQSQYEFRREGMVAQALASFSASFLFVQSFVTKPTEPYIVPSWSYLTLSIFFLALAFFFIIAPINRFLLNKSERIAQILWLALSYTALGGIIVAWIDGVARLDPNGFWFHWFFWLGFIWFIIFCYHSIRSASHLGRIIKHGNPL